jgi:AraC family transcriptional regulator of adaptative response/methylated-DNA-[protein]-cysteine methyltransferase
MSITALRDAEARLLPKEGKPGEPPEHPASEGSGGPAPAPLDDARWAAVLSRDAGWDGRFVMAVSSTRIYCRPSCPARRPSRDRVRFYASPAGARGDGYRACKRCRPDLGADSPAVDLIRRACTLLDDPSGASPTLGVLGKRLGVSPSHLQRTFKRLTGVSPREYADARRHGVLRDRLRARAPVLDAIYEAGYGSSSRVYERAATQLGMTPGRYRNGAAGASIGYTVVETALGKMLVAATERGICRVALGESARTLEHLPDVPLERGRTNVEWQLDGSARTLEQGLAAEFPAASRTREDARLAPWVGALIARIDGRPAVELPLDIRATAFQRHVWQMLELIPRGTTRSYSEIAAAIGRPGAARAVARACASNPVAIAIPCHRVVRGNGELGGYRWGIERKRRLLENESAT